MTEDTGSIVGLDFGTTNSLASVVIGDKTINLMGADGRPHPSVVWYRDDDLIVGREARKYIEATESASDQGFVRSPKMSLRHGGTIHVNGRAINSVDIVAEVLRHVKGEAASGGHDFTRAVMTIPVDFGGPQRRSLRAAALKAGIRVHQFVHEPAAALYAYLRSRPNPQRELAELENRVVLVFDWGGGTLDLTVCRIVNGTIMQIANRGNNEIGGDRFDERLKNQLRDRHGAAHELADVSVFEQPGAAARLLTQCELAKINLSTRERFQVIVRDFIKGEGRQRNLDQTVTRNDLDDLSADLTRSGLSEIDSLLDRAALNRSDIALCLATGGMVNVPAIWNGLVERFGGRVPVLTNRDSIIAEGAAWIANDGLRLILAKPLEVRIADGSGRGAAMSLAEPGLQLPVEGQNIPLPNRRFFCVDPRDGIATFEFVKPRKVGLIQSGDERIALGSPLHLKVDPNAQPFLERLECRLMIDDDYVAHITIDSLGASDRKSAEFHDLEFGLVLPSGGASFPSSQGDGGGSDVHKIKSVGRNDSGFALTEINVSLRPNISPEEGEGDWKCVPGDLVRQWRPNFLNKTNWDASLLQFAEAAYYTVCAYCKRDIYKIRQDGPIDECHSNGCLEANRHEMGSQISPYS